MFSAPFRLSVRCLCVSVYPCSGFCFCGCNLAMSATPAETLPTPVAACHQAGCAPRSFHRSRACARRSVRVRRTSGSRDPPLAHRVGCPRRACRRRATCRRRCWRAGWRGTRSGTASGSGLACRRTRSESFERRHVGSASFGAPQIACPFFRFFVFRCRFLDPRSLNT